jgi:pre-mRNA-processing factor 40
MAHGGGYMQQRMPGYPMANAAAPPVMAPAVDPNNDITCWSEHETADKRKYWYNKAIGTSTYDKPFCMKTPEERSIPPCPWKEYTAADGKKYYSDSKESRWVLLYLGRYFQAGT